MTVTGSTSRSSGQPWRSGSAGAADRACNTCRSVTGADNPRLAAQGEESRAGVRALRQFARLARARIRGARWKQAARFFGTPDGTGRSSPGGDGQVRDRRHGAERFATGCARLALGAARSADARSGAASVAGERALVDGRLFAT